MEPVNLTNLRSMTDGDLDLEKSLFEEFYLSFEAGIRHLQASCEAQAVEAWRKEAHALKGIALNLGAESLGMLCKEAQDKHEAAVAVKQELVGRIEVSYREAKQFLQKVA